MITIFASSWKQATEICPSKKFLLKMKWKQTFILKQCLKFEKITKSQCKAFSMKICEKDNGNFSSKQKRWKIPKREDTVYD